MNQTKNVLPQGRDPVNEQWRGPFSEFQVTVPDENYIFTSFSYLILELVRNDTKYSAPLVVQWLKNKYSDLPCSSSALLFCLVVSLGVNSDFLNEIDMAVIGQELIHKALWESEHEYQDRLSAAILIDQIASLMSYKSTGMTSLSKTIKKKKRDMLLTIIERSIDKFADHVNPKVRAGTAKLLSNWKVAAKDSF